MLQALALRRSWRPHGIAVLRTVTPSREREKRERERVVTLYGPNVLSFMTVCFISICCMMYVLHVRSFLLVHVNSDEFYLNCAKPRPPLGPTTFGAGRRCAAEESQPPMVQTLWRCLNPIEIPSTRLNMIEHDWTLPSFSMFQHVSARWHALQGW